MIEASKTIKTDLLADVNLQAVINGRHYWEIGPDNAPLPLIEYTVIENPAVSKDTDSYAVTLRCFANTLTEAATLGELVKTALKKAHHKYRGARSGYADTETREGFIELNFNFNL